MLEGFSVSPEYTLVFKFLEKEKEDWEDDTESLT
jgi:hypothetical protein